MELPTCFTDSHKKLQTPQTHISFAAAGHDPPGWKLFFSATGHAATGHDPSLTMGGEGETGPL